MAPRSSFYLPLTLCVLWLAGCSSPQTVKPSAKDCTPDCQRTGSCNLLDLQLQKTRKLMLECVGREADKGHVGPAHQCYRALRLVESSRWWLETLMTPANSIQVYKPAERIRMQFLCCIERLAQARTPAQIERLYLDMVRSYP